jgi:Flp pilus assembly protein TadG
MRLRPTNLAPRIRGHRRQSGQGAVEFIFAILFLMLFIAGIIEIIALVYTYNVLAESAKEGVRYAIVHGTGNTSSCSGPGGGGATCADSTAANVTTAVTTYASYSLHDTSAMTITTTYPDSSSVAPNRVRVTISYAYQPLFGLGWPTLTVNAAAEGRIMY